MQKRILDKQHTLARPSSVAARCRQPQQAPGFYGDSTYTASSGDTHTSSLCLKFCCFPLLVTFLCCLSVQLMLESGSTRQCVRNIQRETRRQCVFAQVLTEVSY